MSFDGFQRDGLSANGISDFHDCFPDHVRTRRRSSLDDRSSDLEGSPESGVGRSDRERDAAVMANRGYEGTAPYRRQAVSS